MPPIGFLFLLSGQLYVSLEIQILCCLQYNNVLWKKATKNKGAFNKLTEVQKALTN